MMFPARAMVLSAEEVAGSVKVVGRNWKVLPKWVPWVART